MCYRLLTGKELGRKAISDFGANPAWDAFADKALEQESSARYANGAEMLLAFATVAAVTGSGRGNEAQTKDHKVQPQLSTPNSHLPNPPSPIVNRKPKKALATVAVILLLLVGATVWYVKVQQTAAEARSRQAAMVLAQQQAAAQKAAEAKQQADALAAQKKAEAIAAAETAAKQAAEAKAQADAEAARQAEAKRQADTLAAQQATDAKAAQELAVKQAAEVKAKAEAEAARLADQKRQADELAQKQALDTKTNASSTSVTSPEDAMKSLFGDPVIVKANGFEIKQSELDQVMTGAKANAAAQKQTLPPEFSISILNQLITIQALLQKATPADRSAGAVDAEVQYANLVKRFGSQEAFQRQLTAVGMTVDQLRAKATQEATAKAALKRELNVQVTEAEAQAFYAQHTSDFQQPEMAHVRHILLMTVDATTRSPLSANQIAAKRQQIDDLLKQIRAGADFATLAGQYSEDPGSKDKGGELPAFSHGQMVPEFEAASFSLAPNEVSDVITTQFGYHIIKLLDKTPAKTYAFTNLLPQANKTVAEVCKEQVESAKIKELAPDYVKTLRAEQQVQILDPTLKAQAEAQTK
jgi:parvulin-like peptidyl-prolyl isomerase